MMKGITPSGAFGFYCGICFVGWLFIVFFYPDVKGMPLETIREVFEHGFGRRYSKQWQREHKHERKRVEAAFGH
jgi:SP family myo-inositol transporter-like MFS transporter 13